jgi:acyl-CoA synthetase (AMP-forming)/AMP-acid ligase II
MNIVERYYYKISNYSGKNAIFVDGNYFNYSDLKLAIDNERNNLINKGVDHGDIVFLVGDYSIRAISLFLALALNKNIVVPITTEIEDELSQRSNVLSPDWIINIRNKTFERNLCSPDLVHHNLVDSIKNKAVSGLVLFSSGSTGTPKAMIHDLDNLISVYLDRKPKSLNFLVFLMFDHIGGINTLLNCLSMGSTITIPTHRNPDHICELIETTKINILPASPTFLNLMIIGRSYAKFDLSSLIMITYGTETMPGSLLDKLKQVFPKVKFLQTFGTSETGIAKTTSLSSTSTFVKIDDPDQEYKVVEGELWLKSKTQIMGYINHSNESFTSDGWFKTGDLVQEGENGFIKIIGRTKEVINVGGEKVMPAEVESVILELPWVQDCVVTGKPNIISGQMVTLQVCINDNIDPIVAKSEIRKHCQTRLEAYKVPAKVSIVESVDFSSRFKKIRNK